MKQVLKIASFFVFPITVLVVHFIASVGLHLYTIFPNMDIPFHFAGGFSIAYTCVQILSHLEKEKLTTTLNKVLFLILVFSLTATVTVFWEFAEFIGDQLLNTNIQISLANTMQDQLMGILGGVTWMFIYTKKFEKLAEKRIQS